MSVVARCPGCGADVRFERDGSAVAICTYCRSVVARADREAGTNLGKVADLVDSGSPLKLGLRGSHRGQPFELVGRTQHKHAAGGVWDEWYAAFGNGGWGWIAEAEGDFYLTFPSQTSAPTPLEVGGRCVVEGVDYAVAEVGEARLGFAEGELPFSIAADQAERFADLHGANGAFASVDLDEQPPRLYIGEKVGLADLGLAAARPADHERVAATQARRLACPNCDGALDLRAPDKTQRVACPYCGALLDASKGDLRFLTNLGKPAVELALALGARGTLFGTAWTVIGFLQRAVTFENVEYTWEEYLLYEPAAGFRWLVRSDQHWSFVEPVSGGDVAADERAALYQGKRFRVFQHADAVVKIVVGELYWQVAVGETVRASDYVRAPLMLSRETGAGEETWSLGSYLPVAEVERAFGVRGLPRPLGVAPNQPFPHGSVYPAFAVLAAVFFVGCAITMPKGGHVLDAAVSLDPVASKDDTRSWFSEPFHLDGGQNLRVGIACPLDNSWAYFDADLVDDASGEVVPFNLTVSYYHGYEDGESWSEGAQREAQDLAPLPAGDYVLRLEAQWDKFNQPITASVSVDRGVFHPLRSLIFFALLGAFPVGVAIYQFSFERRRWRDSDYSPFGGS